MATLEKQVFDNIRNLLIDTNLTVSLGSVHLRGELCGSRPDIVVCKEGKAIAFIDVSTRNAYNSRKTRLGRDTSVSDGIVWALTDGDRVLMDTGAVTVELTLKLFVKFLKEEDSSPYRIAQFGKYYSQIKFLVEKYHVETRGLNDWLIQNESNCLFEENGVSVRFCTETLENEFFLNLLGRTNDEELCRYTSLDNLFMILETQQQNMCCVVCMNDKGELTYVDEKINISYQTVPDDSNNCFIMSLLPIKHKDELTYWRLYGQDASGACITYQVNQKSLSEPDSCFYLAKVSYENDDGTHPELDLLKVLHPRGGNKIQRTQTPHLSTFC